jgi:hypothetical protein
MQAELQALGPFWWLLLAALAAAVLYGATLALHLALHALVAWRNRRRHVQVCLLQVRLHGLQQRQRFAQRLQREGLPILPAKEPPHA